jgi:cellobiose transport system substrate-binding protein
MRSLRALVVPAVDVEAIEEGWIGQFKAQPDKLHLNDLGADSLKGQWREWKWETSVATNGAQIGLGTDAGGMAMCYRRDLFEKAGLPTERDQVSALWPTWDVQTAAESWAQSVEEAHKVL